MRRGRKEQLLLVTFLFTYAVLLPSADAQGDVLNITIGANESVEISSPFYPSNYPNYVDMSWLIETQEDQRIRITFANFRTWHNDFFYVGDGADTDAGRFFTWHGTLPQPLPNLLSTEHQMWLRFTSDWYWTERGFSLSAASVPMTDVITCTPGDADCGRFCLTGALLCDGQSDCLDGRDELNCDDNRVLYIGEGETARMVSTSYPGNYSHNSAITWILKTENTSKILVNFLAFDTENGRDFLQVGDGDSAPFFEWSWSRLPPSLLSNGSTLWLRFTSDESVSRSGFELTAIGVQQENLTCSADELDCGHSVCVRNEWQCDHIPDCINEQDESSCDIYLNADESTVITSPLYPTDYPNNIAMALNIRTEEDRKILVTTNDFATANEDGVFQAGDGVKDANNSGVFFVWSGLKHPPRLLSNGNMMWISFVSGKATARRGFSVTATSVPSSDVNTCTPGDADCGRFCLTGAVLCDGQSDCLDGRDELNCDDDRVLYIGEGETARMVSTSYPGNYPHNSAITWILKTENTSKILVNFLAFDTENGRDFLQVGDGDSAPFFEWSWSRLPPSLLSNGSTLWLRFTSDESVSRSGFELTAIGVQQENLTCSADELDCGHSVCVRKDWQCDHIPDCIDERDESSCDIYLNADESTVLTSPLYPTDYPNNIAMALNIRTEEDRKILVTTNDFATANEDGVFQAGDGVKDANNSGAFFVWSGLKHPPRLLSNGSMMWISFESGKATASRGFSVNATSVPSSETIGCTLSEIDCGHSVCVYGSGRCDGIQDCVDGRDETNCSMCEGRCFTDGPRGGCYCDDVCESFRDCCSDFLPICRGIFPPVIDECDPALPLHNCDANAICTDTPESFTCTCTSGFVGNGTTCSDVQPPDISCPAALTVYTDCGKNFSRVLLPEVDSVFDNSGVFLVTINVQGSAYNASDTINLDLSSVPYQVLYNATDDSFNSAQCEMNITVADAPDGSLCTSTANPPHCICLSASAQGCSCSSGYCAVDCSQSSEGVECTGPAMPYPNCTDIDECDPGYSGPRCTSDDGKVQCLEVENICLGEGVSTASISWTLSEDIQAADFGCVDLAGNNSDVNATGGVFDTGRHDVLCSLETGAFAECLISFIVSAYPALTVPLVSDQCTDPGMDTATVTWGEVVAMDAGDVTIECSDSDRSAVSLTGGVFGLGNHSITCRATNAAGCVTHMNFTFTINQGNLLPFGSAIGDELLSDVPQQSFLSSKDLISPTIYPPDFFPFCDGLYEKLFFTDNGVIVLSNEQSLDKQAFPSAQSTTFTGNQAMITPFWADVKADAFGPTSNVFWQEYDQYAEEVNQEMLDSISDLVSSRFANFSATWAFVVTWSKVRAISLSLETNTFQAVLTTDGIQGFVVFNYDPCGMNWDFTLLPNPNVIQGFSCGTSNDVSTYVDLSPDESLYRPGNTVGNLGQTGRWVFRLNNPSQGVVNPRQQCHKWHKRQPPYPSLSFYLAAFAHRCPCTLLNARLDWRFIEEPAYDLPQDLRFNFLAVCYVRLFQSPEAPGPRCCYSILSGSLLDGVRTPRVASVFERSPFSPIFYTEEVYQQWLDEEVWPRYYCCEQSTLCHLYIQWRPLMSCWLYFPPSWLWLWGDPHIVTLDGLEYTFNGLGEYTLAFIEDDKGQRLFELQGRTRQAVDSETGELSKATVYSGFAAVYTGEARIEVKLSDDSMDLITIVNGTVVTPNAQGLPFDNVVITMEENPIKVSVSYSDDATFSIRVNNSMADITVLFSDKFKGKTSGLIGLWDDDASNDLLKRNGIQQTGTGDNGTLLERDFFEFGETWRVMEEDSLFFYQSPNESYANFNNNPDFSPDFLQDLIDKADSSDKYNEAKEVCGASKVCLYDALALNDVNIGMATLTINEMNTVDMAMSANFPPNLTSVDSIEVVVGQTFSLQLQASDQDGDNITYQLLQPVEGASITSDGLFTWTPANRSMVSIDFQATDGMASASLEPIVKLCDCENDGTCLFDQYVGGTNLIQDRFGVVLCECQPGWTGDFCGMDYDACADNPCFLGVNCTDEAPPSYNSTCGACPEGLEGDGRVCQISAGPTDTPGSTTTSGQTDAPEQTTAAVQTSDPGQTDALGPTTASGQTDTPGQTSAPEQTTGPGQTDDPGPTDILGPTTTSGQTDTPGQTTAPGQTSDPGQTDALGPTTASGQTDTPGQTSAPEQTTSPGQTDDPGSTDAQGPTTASGQTDTPGQTSAPGQTTNPGQTDILGPTTTSRQTTAPGQTTDPGHTDTQEPTDVPGPTTPSGQTTDPGHTDTQEPTDVPGPTTPSGQTTDPGHTDTQEPTDVPGPSTPSGQTTDPGHTDDPGPTDAPGPTATSRQTDVPGPTNAQGQSEAPRQTEAPVPTTIPGPSTTDDCESETMRITSEVSTARSTSMELTTKDCQILNCVNRGAYDDEFCECACPLTHAGPTCSDKNPCLSGNRCPAVEHYCLPDLNQDGFTCFCNAFEGYFPQDDGSCASLPSKQIVLSANLDFKLVYKDLMSEAFQRLARTFERAILMSLKGDPTTDNVTSVHVLAIEEGSVIVRSVASFANGAPSDANVGKVMSSSPMLRDDNTVIDINVGSVMVSNGGELDCVPTHCKNGGTCEASGDFPYVSYTCSCQASYTGERCETEVKEPESEDLPTTAVVLIIVSCTILIIIVLCMLVCLCLLIQRQQTKSPTYPRNRQLPREGRSVLVNYHNEHTESSDGSPMADYEDEGARVTHLMNVMSRSPYLQESLPGHEGFVRPYLVTGMEELYREHQSANPGGRFVRNPMAY